MIHVWVPHQFIYSFYIIEMTGCNEKIVAEPIHPSEKERIDILIFSKRENTSLSTSTDRSRHMAMRGKLTASRKDKRPNFGRLGVKNIYPTLNLSYS